MMGDRIQTSTPRIYEKFVPPPPRKLWAADSPAEQLYRNKWTKYRNSFDDNKDNWNVIDAPNFIDFEDIPDTRDTYFDIAEMDNETPKRFITHQRLPGVDTENNNILEELKKCTLSAIKKSDEHEKKNDQSSRLSEVTVHPISDISGFMKKTIGPSTIKMTEASKIPDSRAFQKNVEKQRTILKIAKKTCTKVEPFSFEIREKYRQEHNQARRERDSIGKEPLKGFRANPRPNFLKPPGKIITSGKTCMEMKDANNIDLHKIYSATEIWKKKAFQPVYPKRVPIVPKAPELSTAARARARQRFEEQMREKELQRQVNEKKEEAERKKREEEELVKLRRALVHKAQPIRFKLTVPKVEKRPLTEPTTPITFKRRRRF